MKSWVLKKQADGQGVCICMYVIVYGHPRRDSFRAGNGVT